MSVYQPEVIDLYPGRNSAVIVKFPARAKLAVAAKLDAAGKVIDGVLMGFFGTDRNPEPSHTETHATFYITCLNETQAAQVLRELRRVYNMAA